MDNHIITKFATVVSYAYMSMCPNVGKKTSKRYTAICETFVQHKNICLVIRVQSLENIVSCLIKL